MARLKTYIVEDSRIVRHNLTAALEELTPVEVVGTAEDEDTAVAWLADPTNECDLVIVDIYLKSGTGLGVLEATRAMPRALDLVVLTSYTTPDVRAKCIELGAHRVFDKARDIDELLSYCAGHLP